MGVGRGYGKLLLFGEHAAVYGLPAVGLRIPQYLELTITPIDGEHWQLPEIDTRAAELIARAVDTLPSVLGHPVTAHALSIGGNLPMSVGLGSSAAFCTALLRALDERRFSANGAFPAHDASSSRSIETFWKAAHALEHVFHGTPSGIDTGLSIRPGCSVIVPNPPGLPTATPAQLPRSWVVAGAVPRTGSTAGLVAGIRARRDAEPEATDALLRRLGAISSEAGTMGAAGDAAALGVLADEAHTILSDLELSVTAIDEALELLKRRGSTGGKLSGAGGGGAFFAVFGEEQVAGAAARELNAWLHTHYPLPSGSFAIALPLHQPA